MRSLPISWTNTRPENSTFSACRELIKSSKFSSRPLEEENIAGRAGGNFFGSTNTISFAMACYKKIRTPPIEDIDFEMTPPPMDFLVQIHKIGTSPLDFLVKIDNIRPSPLDFLVKIDTEY